MGRAIMKIEEACQGLELFLSKDKNEKLRERVARFSEDSYFIDYLGGLAKKDIHQVKIEDLVPIANVLDIIVFPDYPVENLAYYSCFYLNAISSSKLKVFNALLNHLNKVGNIEKVLASQGVVKNSNLGNRRSSSDSNTDTRAYVFSEPCYINFVTRIFDDNKDETLSLAEKNFQDAEIHLNFLKSSGFDLNRLFSNGYSNLLKSIYDNQKKTNVNNFCAVGERLAGLFKRFDELGFDMYNEQNIVKVNEWINNGTLNSMKLLTGYMSKEALIYVSGLHLKNQ